MNDSISVNSTYSNSTNSNSANRSLVSTHSSLMNKSDLSYNTKAHLLFSKNTNLLDLNENFLLGMELTPVRRRARSQIIYYGDDSNTTLEYNRQLIEDLIYLKKKLKDRDGEIEKLNDIRNKLESEIQELSASLFEEAYQMVNTAKAETAHFEKLLKEANGKIEVLQAEIKALKELVLTSTPQTPNKHLHPQLNSKNNTHSRQSSLNQQVFTKIISNNHVHHNNNLLNSSASLTPPNSNQLSTSLSYQQISSTNKDNKSFLSKSPSKQSINNYDLNSNPNSVVDTYYLTYGSNQYLNKNDNDINIAPIEFDQTDYKQLIEWKKTPELKCEGLFMEKVYQEDIKPCLKFPDSELSENLLKSIVANCVCIEDLTNSTSSIDNFFQACALSNIPSLCQYKIKLSEDSEWLFISKLSRNKIISVCDFFTYLRYIKEGLVKSDMREIYLNIIELRKKMALSRLGF